VFILAFFSFYLCCLLDVPKLQILSCAHFRDVNNLAGVIGKMLDDMKDRAEHGDIEALNDARRGELVKRQIGQDGINFGKRRIEFLQ